MRLSIRTLLGEVRMLHKQPRMVLLVLRKLVALLFKLLRGCLAL